ncbi:MAG: hypothetical protein ACE5HB_09355, partial [Terriglobia bacterium]
FDAAVSRPRVYRQGRFRLARRFGEAEWFHFPPPLGRARMVLAAQDEVGTLPHFISMQEMDIKIGGNEINRLRRWYRQGKLRPSASLVSKRFPRTPTPRQVARLIRRGVLSNARFALAVVVQGRKADQPLEFRWYGAFPSLYQIRRHGLHATPIAYATAHTAALFIKHFPRKLWGVHPPETLPAEVRRPLVRQLKERGIQLTAKIRKLKQQEDEEDF